MSFRHNQAVEICKKEEGSPATYYTAKILAAIGRTRYLIRYQTRYSEDRTRLLTEAVDESDIRPSPPEVPYTGFRVPDRVDAYVDEAWRVGSITRKVDENYHVKLDCTANEAHCPSDKVRLHLELEDGRWIYYRLAILRPFWLLILGYTQLGRWSMVISSLESGGFSAHWLDHRNLFNESFVLKVFCLCRPRNDAGQASNEEPQK